MDLPTDGRAPLPDLTSETLRAIAHLGRGRVLPIPRTRADLEHLLYRIDGQGRHLRRRPNGWNGGAS